MNPADHDCSCAGAVISAPKRRAGLAGSTVLPLIVLLLVTFAIRALHFGSPDVDYDEPFYLLVGDRMWHSAIPYVDLWDRKPVGLFVLYAAIRALGGNGFFQYLGVAAIFVAGTAALVWDLSKRWVQPWPAILPAITYVVWLEPYSGGGGQTAAFYNLLVVGAFWLLMRARDIGRPAITSRHGMISMLLIGMAIQIKYTVLPEGVYFGLAYLWLLHSQKVPGLRIVIAAVVLAAIALLPTVTAIAWYWQIGHLHEFIYANFLSMFERGHLPAYYVHQNLRFIGVVALPLAGVAVFGLDRLPAFDRPLVLGWLVAALIGFAMIGNFYHYYFMPVLVPLAVCCAPNLSDRKWGAAVFAILLIWPFAINEVDHPRETAERIASVQRLTDRILPHIDARHCLYVFDGPTALYMTTKSCLPSRFVYPDHLTNDAERPALGMDATAELRRILDNKPGAIVTGVPRLVPVLNALDVALMEQRLARDYYPVSRVRHARRVITIWALKHGPGSTASGNGWSATQPIDLYPPLVPMADHKVATPISLF